MAVNVCPRCQRTNPEAAAFCYNDGALLQSRAAASNGKAVVALGQFSKDFAFPSGRRCKNFDEFAQGCQEEWASARKLLREGIFKQFFTNLGRADLVRASQEAMGHADGDMGLASFLGALPELRTLQAKLDVHPRRLELGKMTVGDVRRLQFTVSNTGQGQLQGTLKIDVDGDFLTLADQSNSCVLAVAPKREQKLTLEVNTQTLVALKEYGGAIVVVTNGGVDEIPVRLEVGARPYGSPPFPDAKTPREMAEYMRANSKAAVPLLESGEVFRWFISNNWNYPVQGQPIKGMGGVQQFFEAMGLSKAPPLHLSQTEFRFRCDSPDPIRFQVVLGSQSRKWVYAVVESDRSWLNVLTPQVSGPQKTTILFEVDPRSILNVPVSEAKAQVLANAGQKLPIRVIIESAQVSGKAVGSAIAAVPRPEAVRARSESAAPPRAAPQPARQGSSPTSALLAMALMFTLLRLLLVPVVDFWARPASVITAAEGLNQKIDADGPLNKLGGWLRLPWTRVLLGSGKMPAVIFGDANDPETMDLVEFRYRYVKSFVRDMIFAVGWLGPIFAVVLVRRRGGGWRDFHWSVLAGAALGLIGSATLACAFLLIEAVPHALWDLILAGRGDPILLFVWIVIALVCWLAAGIVAGLFFGIVAPLRRAVVDPVEQFLAWLLSVCGLKRLAQACFSLS